MQCLIKSSLSQAELEDLLGVLLIFILFKDGGECRIEACELHPHPAGAIPFCWRRLEPLKNISPACFIALFTIEMGGAVEGVGVVTTEVRTTK